MSTQLSIKLYDLTSAARTGKLHDVVEREAELARLARTLLRPRHHHAVIVGEPGSGKTSLLEALALRLHHGHYQPLAATRVLRLRTEPIGAMLASGDNTRTLAEALTSATKQLEQAIIIVEDIQLLAAGDPARLELTLQLLASLAAHPGIRLILTTTPNAYHQLLRDDYVFARTYEALELATADTEAITSMIEQACPRLEQPHNLSITVEAIAAAIEYGGRFGHGRALPDAAIRLLEDAATHTGLTGGPTVTSAIVRSIVAERERLPLTDLETATSTDPTDLEPELQQAVVGQAPAIRTIAAHLTKSQLGLGDPTRPRNSFLLLGPSGVGKTETAKALARLVYHNPAALVRLDMSEYSEAHAAVRLIGSPPGYVGYEEGGQLTGAVAREPYSLILLDEIEKAHTKLFDLFLQLLDDGRLTDSSGSTVNFTDTTVLATSNAGSHEIAAASSQGIDVHTPEFMQTTLLPLLLRDFRPEFINRFDAILVYQPLAHAHLVALAQRELRTLETRLQRLGITFDVADTTLATLLAPVANPLFGARPVKRLIAGHFETPIATALVRRQLPTPITITGTEAWLTQGIPA